MGELSIKIKIAEREYPMRVSENEEEHLRLAGRIINEKLKSYGQKFGIEDKQDLLAMTALEAIVEKIKADSSINKDQNNVSEFLTQIENLLDQHNS